MPFQTHNSSLPELHGSEYLAAKPEKAIIRHDTPAESDAERVNNTGNTPEKAIIRNDTPAESDAERVDNTGNTPEERSLLRKCDLHLIPILFTLFIFAFMDRINIGNARIQGLEKDLDMKGSDYNIALFAFFPCYILLEVPSNILLRKARPSTWLSGVMLVWGVVTVCQGLTRSFGGLVACRVILGLAEAGFVPGGLYLISMYYKKYELQWRIGLYVSASIIAGAFAGLLAFAIAKMDGIAGYGGWRWIFIIEGLATCVLAVVSKFLIPDWPEQTKFLSADEKRLLKWRLEQDSRGAKMDVMSRKDFLRICLDWKIWAGIVQYIGIVACTYSASFFLPTILKDLGWTSVRAQVMTIPVYLVTFVISVGTSFIADKARHRSGFIMFALLLSIVGYSLLLGQRDLSEAVKYFATFLVVSGNLTALPLSLGWMANQMGGHHKKSVASGMQLGIGNVGGILASNIFLESQAPTYHLGYGICLGMLGLAAGGVAWMLIGTMIENKRRDRGERDWRLDLPEEQVNNLGDDHPHFRYTY